MADAAQVQHENGTTTDYDSGANTDVSRGTALLTAIAAAQPWETVVAKQTAGNFDVVRNQVAIPANVTLDLASKTLYTQLSADLDSAGDAAGTSKACVQFGNNATFKNATVLANNTRFQQTAFGSKSADGVAFANAHIENVTIGAAVACLHFASSSTFAFTGVFKNVTMFSEFDCGPTVLSTGCAAGTIWVNIGCTSLSKWQQSAPYHYGSYETSTLPVSLRGVTVGDADFSFYDYGSSITVYDDLGAASSAVSCVTRTNGSVNLYGTTLSSTVDSPGVATALDIAGNTSVSDTVTYNAGKTTGTITPVSTGRPAPCTNLVATAGAGKIDLTWDNNWSASHGTGLSATGIKVEVSSDNSNWSALGSTLAASATSTSHTGLSEGDLRYYRVRSTNATGDAHMNSNVVRATAEAVAEDPGETPRERKKKRRASILYTRQARRLFRKIR